MQTRKSYLIQTTRSISPASDCDKLDPVKLSLLAASDTEIPRKAREETSEQMLFRARSAEIINKHQPSSAMSPEALDS
jgi:hypothetical protein